MNDLFISGGNLTGNLSPDEKRLYHSVSAAYYFKHRTYKCSEEINTHTGQKAKISGFHPPSITPSKPSDLFSKLGLVRCD